MDNDIVPLVVFSTLGAIGYCLLFGSVVEFVAAHDESSDEGSE